MTETIMKVAAINNPFLIQERAFFIVISFSKIEQEKFDIKRIALE